MNFALTEDQQMIAESAREFAQERIAPRAALADETAKLPMDVIRELGELGYMGMMVPEQYGGAGLDTISYLLALIEFSKADASTGVTMSVNNSLVCDPLFRFGTDEQKARILVDLASGKKLGAYCLTEPNAGSDASNTQTIALDQGDGTYRANGTKIFVTNGGFAEWYVVYARTDKSSAGPKGVTAFMVERSTPGLTVSKHENKMGIRASSTTEIVFDNAVFHAKNVLGEVGSGFKVAMATLDGGRLGIAAQAIGIAQAAYEAALTYAHQRVQFQKRLVDFQATQFKLADMALALDASRLLLLRAGWMKDNGMRFSKEASMAKLFASENANRIAHQALQIHGGYGYIKEFPVERYYRDAKITELYEGTSEVQRIVISSNILKEFAAAHDGPPVAQPAKPQTIGV